MITEKDRRLNTIASYCLVLVVAIYSVMGILFALPALQFSQYFAAVFAMNADMLGTFMQSVHQNEHASLLFLLFVLDYIFFISLGLFFYFKCQYYARSIVQPMFLATASRYMSFLGPVSVFFDAIETGIILFVILTPFDFPSWLVYIQTPFMLLALLVDFIAIGWIIYCSLSLRFMRKT